MYSETKDDVSMKSKHITNILQIIVLIGVAIVIANIVFTKQHEKEINDWLYGQKSKDTFNVDMVVENEGTPYWQNRIADMNQDLVLDTLTLDIAITYFTNSDSIPVDFNVIKKSFKDQEKLFHINGMYIKFNFLPIIAVTGTPEDNKDNPEGKDLDYYSYSANYWTIKYFRENAMNAFIFNDKMSPGTGQALGIPSNGFKIKLDAIHPKYATVAHELAHAFGGLFHTHALDRSDKPYDSRTGDRISDTRKSCPLTYLVKSDCKFIKDHIEARKKIAEKETVKTNPANTLVMSEYETQVLTTNIMSYTLKICRKNFTKEQVAKMKYTIYTNSDIRDSFQEFRKESVLRQMENML